MADGVAITPGVGASIATDEVTDATLGTVQVQYVKLMDGTLNATNKGAITATGELYVAFLSPQHAIIDSGTVTISGSVSANGATVTTDQLRASASSVTSVGASLTSVQLLASGATTRRQAKFYNDSTSACYLKEGTTASSTSFTIKMDAGGYYESYGYTGRVDCIWVVANGSMRITELT